MPLHRFALLSLGLSGLLAGPALAAPACDERTALSAFLEGNPRIAAIRQQVEVARAQAVSAGVLANPTLDVGRDQVFLAGGPAEENRLALRTPLSLGGKRELRQAIAQSGIEAAEARANQQILDLSHEFRLTFARAHRQESGAAVMADGLVTYRRLERIAEARQRAGEGAGYDVLRLRLARSTIESRQTDAQTQAGEERARIAGLLGRPLEGPLQPMALGAVPESPALVELALARRADLLALRSEQAQAGTALTLAERTRWPDPEVALGLRQTNEPTVQGFGYTAGLAWPLPIFDRAQGAQASARAELARLQAEEAAIAARLRVEIPAFRQALAARLAAAERFEREVLARVPEVVRVAEVAYREGDQGLAPLLDAHQAALDARLHALDLSLLARTTRLELERLIGSALPEPQRSHP
ncbi:MAG: TolC family protein [Candidatus Sericytochromatia bacterium]